MQRLVGVLGKLKFSYEFSLTFNMQPVSALCNSCFVLVLHQLGGSFLLGVGVWVLVDPTGFREIIAANPLLFSGVYVILGLGGMLFLLGFLGCCGAIRENKCLLLFVSRNSEPVFKSVSVGTDDACLTVSLPFCLFHCSSSCSSSSSS